MDMCELYGCGSGSYWTREDLDELWGDTDDLICPWNIWLTAVFVKKEKNKEILDVEYRYTINGDEYHDTLKARIVLDHRKAPTPRKLVEVYAPILAKAVREEVAEAMEEARKYE